MRRDILLGLALTAASILSLISYHAGATVPASNARADYAIAITTGNGLRLASPEGWPAAGPGPGARAEGVVPRTLSCSGVVRLGVVDVGYSCATSVQSAATGSL